MGYNRVQIQHYWPLNITKVALRFENQFYKVIVLRYLLVLLLPLFVFAKPMSSPLLSVTDESATAKTPKLQVGVSGFVVRHFNDEHTSIIASATVTAFDDAGSIATISLRPYDGLRQNSLPNGTWTAQVGDELVMAFGYARALLIAPNESIYHNITSRVKSIDWQHPDGFATTLSYAGHPTPLVSDFNNFCTATASGLLYVYTNKTLFTLDCKSMKLLQITPAPFKEKETKLPFYSRVDEIRAAWWGEGSNELESYEPFYLELIIEHNQYNQDLYTLVKNSDITTKEDLLDEFDFDMGDN